MYHTYGFNSKVTIFYSSCSSLDQKHESNLWLYSILILHNQRYIHKLWVEQVFATQNSSFNRTNVFSILYMDEPLHALDRHLSIPWFRPNSMQVVNQSTNTWMSLSCHLKVAPIPYQGTFSLYTNKQLNWPSLKEWFKRITWKSGPIPLLKKCIYSTFVLCINEQVNWLDPHLLSKLLQSSNQKLYSRHIHTISTNQQIKWWCPYPLLPIVVKVAPIIFQPP